MFEHLDDPAGPPPSGPLRTAVRAGARRRRQRRAAVVAGVAAVGVLGASVAASAVSDRVSPERVEVAGLPEEGERPSPGEPMTVLMVGTDGAGLMVGTDGVGPDDPGHTDTIVVARVEPDLGELRLMAVPRDLLVEWDGRQVRVNTLLAAGGPTALVEVVDAQLGVAVDHYVQVDFAGAVELVDAVGGARVAVDRAVRDDATGLALDAGCHTLDGEQVLALGRSRSFQYEIDGTWHVDPTSDLGRQRRGSTIAAALLQAVGRIGLADLPALVDAGLGAVTVDADLDVGDVRDLARSARGYRLVPVTIPVEEALGPGGAAVLELAPDAAEAIAALDDEAPSPAVGEDAMRPAYTVRPC